MQEKNCIIFFSGHFVIIMQPNPTPNTRQALKFYLEQTGTTLAELSRGSQINASLLSQILSGGRPCTQETIHKLILSGSIPPAQSRHLLISYLRDLTPEAYQDQIRIQPTPPLTLAELEAPTDPLETALEFLRHRAQTQPDFYKWLLSLHQILSGKSLAIQETISAMAKG